MEELEELEELEEYFPAVLTEYRRCHGSQRSVQKAVDADLSRARLALADGEIPACTSSPPRFAGQRKVQRPNHNGGKGGTVGNPDPESNEAISNGAWCKSHRPRPAGPSPSPSMATSMLIVNPVASE